MGVLLQAVYIFDSCGIVCGETDNANVDPVFLMIEDKFLTPVANDISPKLSPLSIACYIAVTRQLGYLNETSVEIVLYIYIIMTV